MQPAEPHSTSSSSLKLERQKLISKLFQYSKPAGKTRSSSKLSKRINAITSQLSRLQSENLPSLMYTTPPPNNPKTSGKAQTGLNLLPEPIRNVISNKMATNENTQKGLDLPKVSTKDDGLGATSFFVPLSKPPHSTELSNQTTTKESSQLNKSLTKEEKLQAFYEKQMREMRKEFDDRLSKQETQLNFFKNAVESRSTNLAYTGTIPKTNHTREPNNLRIDSPESDYKEISPKKIPHEKSFNYENLSENHLLPQTMRKQIFSESHPSAPPRLPNSQETPLNDFSHRNRNQQHNTSHNLPQNPPHNFPQNPPPNYWNQYPFMYNPHMSPNMPYPLYPPANNYPLQSGHTRNFDENPRNRFNHQEPQCRRSFLRYLDSIPIFTGRSHEDLQSFVEVCDRIDNICENESEYGEFLTRVKFQLRGKAYAISASLNDWMDIRSNILSKYEYLANHDILDSQIENLRQEKDENLAKFTERAMNLFVKKNEMYCSLSEEQKRDHDRVARKAFARGLFNQTLRETICRQRFSTLEDSISVHG